MTAGTATIAAAVGRGSARTEPVAPLSPAQIRWLGALLFAAQLPHIAFVPAWVAGVAAILVGLRFAFLRRGRGRPGAMPARILSWTLVLFAIAAGFAIRRSYGYFIGRDPCVAFLLLLVGIKFLEARNSRDGTLLVCLASFLIITPFFYAQSLLAAAATAPALLALGATLHVLARPSTLDAAFAGWREPLGRTFRMFVQGIPLAAVLFLLFPRLAGPLWGLPADHTARSGLSDRMAPGMISHLSLSDAVAFRVDFDGPVPPAAQRYWRGPVLSAFDGNEWTMLAPRPDGALAQLAGKAIAYTVTLEPHGKPWLFALELPASMPDVAAGPGDDARGREIADLTRDQQLIARVAISQPLRYRLLSDLRATHPVASGERLATEIAENLRLPSGARRSNPRTQAFARELRGSHPNDAEYVAAVLGWFRSEPFAYTLEPPLLQERDPVDMFLFDTRRGFCEHYASAFVVLLRAAGIPARVVTGYQGGDINPNGGYLIVRQSDAHAWAEALIDGQWRRFDPTAAVAPSRIELGLGGALPASEYVPLLARLDNSFIKSLQLSWDAFNHDWRRNVIGFDYVRQRSLWRDWKFDRLAPWQMVATAAALGSAWVGAMLGWHAWRRRRQDRARAIWDSLCARLARAGLPRQPYEGPLDYASRAAARWPEFALAFRMIGDSYAALRYGAAAGRDDADRERASTLARFAHAVSVLPASAALRASAASAASA